MNSNIFTIIAVVLLAGWLLGYIGFGEAVGSLIHILLVLAVISLLIQVVRKA